MVPPELSKEVFRLFMQIPKSRIEEDIEGGIDTYDTMRLRVDDFLDLDDNEMTPEVCAEFLHAGMVQARIAQDHPRVHEAVAFYLAGTAARLVTMTAAFAAEDQGSLGALKRERERMLEEAGVGDDENWEGKVKPPGYDEVCKKIDGLFLKIDAMMMGVALNRYGLYDHARLYEEDERAFSQKFGEGYDRIMEKRFPQ